MATKPETPVKQRIVKELRTIPNSEWIVIDQEVKRGDADLFGCVCGRFFAIEVKEKFTERYDSREKLQRHKMAKIIESGGIAMFMTKDNWRFHVNRIKEMEIRWSKNKRNPFSRPRPNASQSTYSILCGLQSEQNPVVLTSHQLNYKLK